jgi:hypothetical protein
VPVTAVPAGDCTAAEEAALKPTHRARIEAVIRTPTVIKVFLIVRLLPFVMSLTCGDASHA